MKIKNSIFKKKLDLAWWLGQILELFYFYLYNFKVNNNFYSLNETKIIIIICFHKWMKVSQRTYTILKNKLKLHTNKRKKNELIWWELDQITNDNSNNKNRLQLHKWQSTDNSAGELEKNKFWYHSSRLPALGKKIKMKIL